MSVSIQEVAKCARVSISTVSRVVNQRKVVSPKTRSRVERAIAKLGYRPNGFARGLMLRRSHMVGLLLPDLHGEFYSEIIRGADAQATDMGYHLVVSLARDGHDADSVLERFQRLTILDGIVIMVSEVTDPMQERIGGLRLPLVILDGSIEGIPHDSVTIDQRAGAQALVRHLVRSCGIRRLIFVGGPKTNVDTMARLGACKEVLRESAIRLLPSDVHHLDYHYEPAYTLSSKLSPSWAGKGHAVFAANDDMACGIIDAAAAQGIRVPQDLAVVGFDDTRIARINRPPLTTVRVPMSRLGGEAIRLLCERLSDPSLPPREVVLSSEIVVRESCGARQAAS